MKTSRKNQRTGRESTGEVNKEASNVLTATEESFSGGYADQNDEFSALPQNIRTWMKSNCISVDCDSRSKEALATQEYNYCNNEDLTDTLIEIASDCQDIVKTCRDFPITRLVIKQQNQGAAFCFEFVSASNEVLADCEERGFALIRKRCDRRSELTAKLVPSEDKVDLEITLLKPNSQIGITARAESGEDES